MAKSQKSMKLGALRRRGWTDGLIASLLPEPRVFYGHGRPFRVWRTSDVLAAEQTAEFIANHAEITPSDLLRRPTRGDCRSARRLFEESWSRAEKDGSAPWILAGLYHSAILVRLSSAVSDPTSSQVSSWTGEFLALERTGSPRHISEALRGLTRSALWLDSHRGEPVCDRVIDRYPHVLRAISESSIADLGSLQSEENIMNMLTSPDFPLGMLFKDGLSKVWSVWYVPRAIRTSLQLLVALNPKDEYPEARAMRRHFVLHIGGTNTGKTYAGFTRLMQSPTGVYLAPLRLLALEAQETLLDARVDCSLATGEEEDSRPGDTHVAATAEKLDMKRLFDVAVIDECQMICDPQRGYAWTRAILGVLAPEVHLCAAPEAEDILIRLIASCGDTYEVIHHRRTTPLIPMRRTVDPTKVQPGDALITFSKVGVLSVAEELRAHGKEPAIIYGALPYATRRKQMEGFLRGDMEYVVSTDAIGMGLNLPIRRIIFMETEKFDGVERRELRPEEIKQIAGRAGRLGMYSRGYVGATQNLPFIKAGLEAPVPPIEKAVVGFSDLVLQVDFDLLEVLTEWNKLPTVEPYVKLDISRYITIISKMRELGLTFSKEEELRAANIPFDETTDQLRDLFFEYLLKLQRGEPIEQPALAGDKPTLLELELYYKKLDLYYSFSRAFDLSVDEDRLFDTREAVADDINEILLKNLKNNIRFCAKCGAPLSLYQKGRLCDKCYYQSRRPQQRRKPRKK